MKYQFRRWFRMPVLILIIATGNLYLDAETETKATTSGFNLEATDYDPFSPYLQLTLSMRINSPSSAATILRFSAGGGYYNNYFWRNPDGTLFEPADNTERKLAEYRNGIFDYTLGLSRELFPGIWPRQGSLELFLWYRGILKSNFANQSPQGSLIFASGLPDSQGIWQNSILSGFYLNTVKSDNNNQSRRGMLGQAVWECSPHWLGNAVFGDSDFYRTNFFMINYFPLLTNDVAAIYLAQLMTLDLLWGQSIPIHARQAIGGRFTSLGLGGLPGTGGTLRGVDAQKYDAYLKILHNLDLRLFFPSLISNTVMPGMIVYFDAGAYDDLTYRLNRERILISTGGGLILHLDSIILFPFSICADLMVVANYNFNEKRVTPSLHLSTHF